MTNDSKADLIMLFVCFALLSLSAFSFGMVLKNVYVGAGVWFFGSYLYMVKAFFRD